MNLNFRFIEKKSLIHKALCGWFIKFILTLFMTISINLFFSLIDSINTALVMKELMDLISSANTYMSKNYNLPSYNHTLIKDIALYITNLMRVIVFIKASCVLSSV